MKHEPWQYALTVAVICLIALPAALAVSVFLLLVAAVALCLCPLVAIAFYFACKTAQRAERRKKYGGPVSVPAHPVETCSCEVCAARREYLYGSREPQTQG